MIALIDATSPFQWNGAVAVTPGAVEIAITGESASDQIGQPVGLFLNLARTQIRSLVLQVGTEADADQGGFGHGRRGAEGQDGGEWCEGGEFTHDVLQMALSDSKVCPAATLRQRAGT